MNKEEFRKQARSAIDDGSRARAGIAQAQANEFLTNSAEFDPRVLRKLGSSGLKHFLCSIDQSNLLIQSAIETPSKKPTESSRRNRESLGWDNERRTEPMWTIRALIYGLSAGFMLLALSTTVLKMVNLRIY